MAASVGSHPAPGLRDFVFTEKLGSGTYATVYKAYRKGGQREVVAIKCVEKASLNKITTENLLTEIELLKRLRHEHIVQLKDFQWDQHYIYLIMEYCSGGDLSRFIQSHRTLSEIAVKRFLQQLALALKYMRSENVAHMDLKPQNILLSSPTNPTLKVGDFGFAHYLIGDTEAGILRGSPLYMAPEIVIHRHYNEKADLWSTGVILYECLFGRAPFASRTLRELEMKIKARTSIELPYGVQVSDHVRNLLRGLLKRDPEDRMSYDDFLSHPFVDLDHAPSKDSLEKAIELSAKAVVKDKTGDLQEAIKLYCQSLEYYVPAIHYEKDHRHKAALRKRVSEYMDRAEELKNMLKPDQIPQDETEDRPGGSTSQPEEKPLEVLMEMSSDDQHLLAALKLIKVAEYKEHREDYDTALEKYELALGALIQLLKAESKGKRRDLLHSQVPQWMSRAERIKAFLEVRKMNIEQIKAIEQQQEEDSLHMLKRQQKIPSVRAWFNKRLSKSAIFVTKKPNSRSPTNLDRRSVSSRTPGSPCPSVGLSSARVSGHSFSNSLSRTGREADVPGETVDTGTPNPTLISSGSLQNDPGLHLIDLGSELSGFKLDPGAEGCGQEKAEISESVFPSGRDIANSGMREGSVSIDMPYGSFSFPNHGQYSMPTFVQSNSSHTIHTEPVEVSTESNVTQSVPSISSLQADGPPTQPDEDCFKSIENFSESQVLKPGPPKEAWGKEPN